MLVHNWVFNKWWSRLTTWAGMELTVINTTKELLKQKNWFNILWFWLILVFEYVAVVYFITWNDRRSLCYYLAVRLLFPQLWLSLLYILVHVADLVQQSQQWHVYLVQVNISLYVIQGLILTNFTSYVISYAQFCTTASVWHNLKYFMILNCVVVSPSNVRQNLQ